MLCVYNWCLIIIIAAAGLVRRVGCCVGMYGWLRPCKAAAMQCKPTRAEAHGWI